MKPEWALLRRWTAAFTPSSKEERSAAIRSCSAVEYGKVVRVGLEEHFAQHVEHVVGEDCALALKLGQQRGESLRRAHAVLNRAVRRAMALDLVKRNVVELAAVPTGQREGRRSKSLTPEQADQVLTLTANDRMHAYIVVSLLTGGRTEELRDLRWKQVHLEPTEHGNQKIGPYMEVWRSVR